MFSSRYYHEHMFLNRGYLIKFITMFFNITLFLFCCTNVHLSVVNNESTFKYKITDSEIYFFNANGKIINTIKLGDTIKDTPGKSCLYDLKKLLPQYTDEFIINNLSIRETDHTEYRVSSNGYLLIMVQKYKRLIGNNISKELTLHPFSTQTIIHFFDLHGTKLWDKDFFYAGTSYLAPNTSTVLIFASDRNGEKVQLNIFDIKGNLLIKYPLYEVYDLILSDDGKLCVIRSYDPIKNLDMVIFLNVEIKKYWEYKYNLLEDGVPFIKIDDTFFIVKHSNSGKIVKYDLAGREVR